MVNPTLTMLGIGVVALIAVLVVIDYLWVSDRNIDDAARRTSQRFFGVGIGILMAVVAVAVDAIQLAAEVPGMIIAATGVGQVVGAISLTLNEFVAVAVVTYLIAAAITMED